MADGLPPRKVESWRYLPHITAITPAEHQNPEAAAESLTERTSSAGNLEEEVRK
jgi:hypothetical protein